jgi:hypothetical protein
MLLGFIISEHDIEANQEKISAITRMGPIQNLGVQRITWCLAALSRFISRLAERGLLLYRLLKRTDRFMWIVETQEALNKLKDLLTKALILTPSVEKELLLLYIMVTT